ncbi:MAG: DinB family protein [Deinococcota bacterium]
MNTASNTSSNKITLNSQLLKRFIAGMGFMPTARALSGLSADIVQQMPEHAPHSIADIVAHLDFWQTWVLANIQGDLQTLPARAALGWPKPRAWDDLLEHVLAGLEHAQALCDDTERLQIAFDPDNKIGASFSTFSVADALLDIIAVHNAHHLGQIILLRRMLDVWPPEGGGMTW